MKSNKSLMLFLTALVLSTLLFGYGSEITESAEEGITVNLEQTHTTVVNTEEIDSIGLEETSASDDAADIESINEQATEKPAAEEPDAEEDELEHNQMKLQIGEYTLTAMLEDNSSTKALIAALEDDPITIDMSDYANMEKVGSLGVTLPRNDEQITTKVGDLILYQGNAFVIYYAPNSWSFTRLGKIDDVTQEELKEILRNGDVNVTLSLG